MQDKDEKELNMAQKMQEREEAINNYIRSKMNLKRGYKIRSAKLSSIPLTENYESGELGVVEIVSKDGKSAYVLLDFEIDEAGEIKAKQVGQIKQDGELMLEQDYIRSQQELLKEQGYENYEDTSKKIEEKHYLTKNKETGDLKAVSEKEHEKIKTEEELKMKKINDDLGDNGLGEPLQVVELDYIAGKEYSKLDNKINPRAGKIVLVKYPGGKWITAQERENGYEQVAGIECLELNREIVDSLNITVYSSRGIRGKDITAGEKDDDAYADFLYLRPTDSLDKGDIINYNRWGNTDRYIINNETGEKVELINSTDTYPEKIEIGGKVVEITSNELQTKKDELTKKIEEYREQGYSIDEKTVEEIENAQNMEELDEVEKGIENSEKEEPEKGQGTERTLWENNPYGE